jgi:undecaprenyl phosphate N,N'-diacetylbacillosamine 1-phosphate transferase
MYKRYCKRWLDVCLAVAGLALLSPLMGTIGLAVWMKMGPPILFRQQRPGQSERMFTLYKFRTLPVLSEGEGFCDSACLPPLERFLRTTSLDELPQLINIIKGDMSFIGPRPLLSSYLPYYSSKERERHRVRPGLTGKAQINGRSLLGWKKRLELDVEYVRTISFLGDAGIFFQTVKKVIRRENALPNGRPVPMNFAEERRREIEHTAAQRG